MPYKDFEITKLYYPIGEVAEIFDVNTSLIRYWEKEFDILKPRKNRKGNRLFTKKDLENLKNHLPFGKEKGYTLEGAKLKLKNNKTDVLQNQQIIDSLQSIKSF